MTYKRADRLGWPRLRAQRFICQPIADARVSGYATLLHMVEVAEPLWVMHNEQRVLIADAGYSWLQIFPEGTNYTHTTMFDPEGQPVQEYIDIVAEHGVGDDGIPWYDDLYLDITWIPEGGPLLLDQEELEAAHAIGAITQEYYDLARGETARLLVALALGDYTLPETARALYPTLRAALDEADAAPEMTPAVTDDTAAAVATSEDTVLTEEPVEIVETEDTSQSSAAQATGETASAGEPDGPVESVDRPAEDGEQHA